MHSPIVSTPRLGEWGTNQFHKKFDPLIASARCQMDIHLVVILTGDGFTNEHKISGEAKDLPLQCINQHCLYHKQDPELSVLFDQSVFQSVSVDMVKNCVI